MCSPGTSNSFPPGHWSEDEINQSEALRNAAAAVRIGRPPLGSKRARARSAEARLNSSRERSLSPTPTNISLDSDSSIDKNIDYDSDREVDLSGLETDADDEEEITKRYDLLW